MKSIQKLLCVQMKDFYYLPLPRILNWRSWSPPVRTHPRRRRARTWTANTSSSGAAAARSASQPGAHFDDPPLHDAVVEPQPCQVRVLGPGHRDEPDTLGPLSLYMISVFVVAEGDVADVEQPGRDPGGGLGHDLVSAAPCYKVEKLKRLPDSATGQLLGLVVEGSKLLKFYSLMGMTKTVFRVFLLIVMSNMRIRSPKFVNL